MTLPVDELLADTDRRLADAEMAAHAEMGRVPVSERDAVWNAMLERTAYLRKHREQIVNVMSTIKHFQ